MWLPMAGVLAVAVSWAGFVVWFHYRVPKDKKQDYGIQATVSAIATVTAFWLAFVVSFYGVSQSEKAVKAREERLQKQLMTTRVFYVYQEVSHNKETLGTIIWGIKEGPTHADVPITLIKTVHVNNLLNSPSYYRFGSSDFIDGLADVSHLTKDLSDKLGKVTGVPGLELLPQLSMINGALETFSEVIRKEPKLDPPTWDREREKWDEKRWPTSVLR